MSEADIPAWLEDIAAQTGALPLTTAERALLRDVLAPLISDIAATSAVEPVVGEFQWDLEPDVIAAFIGHHHNAQGIRIHVGLPAGERLAEVADQVQEWAIEAQWLGGGQATWPECPHHPRSHPLAAGLDRQGIAVWRCPSTGHVVCEIGNLNR